MKEIYNANLPKRIMFGDAQYFEKFKGKRMEPFTMDFNLRIIFCQE